MTPDELADRIVRSLPGVNGTEIVGTVPASAIYVGKFQLGQRVIVMNPFVKMVKDIIGGRGYYGHVAELETDPELGVGMVHVQLSGCTGERSPIHELLTGKPLPFFEFELEAAD